ncbi:MAG: hypothetical protein WC455_13575 [Dehalococcoidia bacterium]|jgi:hypothetical protein
MRILGLEFGKKAKKEKEDDDGWKNLKEIVDRVFENTKTDRAEMQENLDLYNGKIWNEKELRPEETRAYHNLAFSTVQSIAPTLSDNRPIWSLVSRYHFTQKIANSYDAALRYAWDKQEMSMTVHECTLDAMIQKVGIFYVYYDYDGKELCIEAQDPKTFFIAPGYSDPWKAPWCGIRERKPLSALRAMFPDVEEIKPDGDDAEAYLAHSVKYGEASDTDLDQYFATLTILWMKDEKTEREIEEEFEVTGENGEKTTEKRKRTEKAYENGKFVYFTGDQYLGTLPSDFDHGKPPWVPLYNYKKPHDFLGTSEIDHIKGLIREYNLQLQKILGWLRKYSDPNWLFDANQIADENFKQTFHKGGQIYAVDKSNATRPAVEKADVGQVQTDIYNVLGLIPRLIEEDSGATDVSKGIASKKQRQSASEIAILVESSYTRTRQRVRNLEWSLKRVCWLLVRLMQQYYDEDRPFHNKKDDEVMFDNVSNKRDFAVNRIVSPQTMLKGQQKEEGQEVQMNEKEQEEYEDYKKFCEVYGDQDPVYFDFDIEIQTNSSLPLDKQSLANLAVRLYQMKAIDRSALLETLQYPRWEDISERMDKMEQAAQQPPGAPPAGPEGTAMGGQEGLDMGAQMASLMGQGQGEE